MSWGMFGAALGGNLIGASMAQDAQRSANKANKAIAEQDRTMQREFAQNGIRWKVMDAKAAGIHPLAALGAQGASASPAGIPVGADLSMANAMSNTGQDIGRAIQSTRTAEERQLAQLQLANAQADLDGKTIDNQIRSSQLQKMQAVGPAFPSPMDSSLIPGQGDAVPGFKVMQSEAKASSLANAGVQAGAINQLQYTKEPSGKIGIAPSSDAKERNEDDLIAETLWHLKNRLAPPPPDPAQFPPPKGSTGWVWSPMEQAFVGNATQKGLSDTDLMQDSRVIGPFIKKFSRKFRR